MEFPWNCPDIRFFHVFPGWWNVMTYYIRDIYIYQIDFIVVGMGPLLKLGQIRQRETGDSSCFCIFLVALLIRASADLAIVGDNFGSLLVIPMDENSWLPPCQFPAIHQIKIIVFLRFYDVEHAAAHDMMAYFSHMIARPVRRHWEGVVTFQLPDRTNWNDATWHKIEFLFLLAKDCRGAHGVFLACAWCLAPCASKFSRLRGRKAWGKPVRLPGESLETGIIHQ